MNNLIIAEFLKLKRFKITYISLAVLLVTIINGIIRWSGIRRIYGFSISWNYLFPFIEIESSNGLLMIMVCMVTGYIFTCEYMNNCMAVYSLYPCKAAKAYLSKLLASCIYTLINVMTLFILNIITGFVLIGDFIYLSHSLLIHHLKIYLYIYILLISIIPLVALASAVIKKYVVVLLMILLVFYLNFRFSEVWHLDKLIWNVMNRIIQSSQVNLSPRFRLFQINDYKPYIVSALLSFILPLVLGVLYYRQMNSNITKG